jgi:hypothetical protein
MKRLIFALAALCPCLTAWAIPFQGTYTVDVNASDPGLVVHATPSSGTLDFDLDVGEQTSWITLFRIYTLEGTVNHDDETPIDASIAFDFVAPESFGGTSNGETYGVSKFWGLWQHGQLNWANGGLNTLYFGNGGILDLYLQDTQFGGSFGGLEDTSGTVKGRFAFRQGPITVTEPATLTLLGAGLLLVALIRRRLHSTQRRD